MLSVEEGRARLLAALPPARVETVDLWDACGRVLAEDVCAREDVPAFDRAAMDGYAVRAADVAGASVARPARLDLVGAVMAGGRPLPAVEPGTAAVIATGAPLPPGADAVVRCELAREQGERVLIFQPVRPGENVGARGEDIRAGALAVPRGTLLRPPEIGMLAAVGASRVAVVAAPRAVLIPTGDEVVDAETVPGPGQVRNSTAYALAAALRQCGALPRLAPRVPDRLDAIAAALEAALPAADLILTTGGVSVGRRDLVREAVKAVGADLLYWRVGIKPGKNIVAARWRHALVIGLSGNPASALATFDAVVRPAVAALAGRPRTRPASVTVVLDRDVPRIGGLSRLLRARVWREGGRFRARLAASQLPSVLGSLTRANAFVVVPRGRGVVPAGQPLTALLMDGAEADLIDGAGEPPADGAAGEPAPLGGGAAEPGARGGPGAGAGAQGV